MEGLIVLLDSEERVKRDCDRIAREVEDVAENPEGESKVIIAPVYKRQAELIKARLTPTFFARYSFRFEEYFGQVDVYHCLIVEINRMRIVA